MFAECASGEAGEESQTTQDSALAALRKHFGYSEFRPGQLDAIVAVQQGKDVFVRLATGSGKTLCMFIPVLAAHEEAMGIIVSPLSGLIDQQIEQLKRIGVCAICSQTTNYDSFCDGKYRFIFTSPEIITSAPWCKVFSRRFVKKNLVMLAIDEAHCITDWGDNFRVSFKKLGGLRASTSVPIMALTATASPKTQLEITESLCLNNPVVISGSLNRPNIFLSASTMNGLHKDLDGVIDWLGNVNVKSIPKTLIFTQTKNTACRVYSLLSKAAYKTSYITMYHASLTSTTKLDIRKSFQKEDGVRCIVATIAFGMGMDIPDVGFVIVYGVPDSMSQLHQLCGRAGRDGCTSRAL